MLRKLVGLVEARLVVAAVGAETAQRGRKQRFWAPSHSFGGVFNLYGCCGLIGLLLWFFCSSFYYNYIFCDLSIHP